MSILDTVLLFDRFDSDITADLDTHTPDVPGTSPWVATFPGVVPQFEITPDYLIRGLFASNDIDVQGNLNSGFFVEFDFYCLQDGNPDTDFLVYIHNVGAIVHLYQCRIKQDPVNSGFRAGVRFTGAGPYDETPVPVVNPSQAKRFRFATTNYNRMLFYINNNLAYSFDMGLSRPDPSFNDWKINLIAEGLGDTEYSYEISNLRIGIAEDEANRPPPKVAIKVVNHTMFYQPQ